MEIIYLSFAHLTFNHFSCQCDSAWDKASPEDLENYKVLVNFHLRYLLIPSSPTSCSDFTLRINFGFVDGYYGYFEKNVLMLLYLLNR